MKTETDYQKVKREFNTQLETAVKAKGGIDITTNADEPIDMLMLTNFKGVYGVDAGELIKIEAIMQSTSTGKTFAYNSEHGEMELDFDFMGSKTACYKYLYEHEQQNKIKVAELLTKHIDRVGKREALINEVAMFEVHVR